VSLHLCKAIPGYQPLYCRPDSLILLRGRTLYRSDLELRRFVPFCKLPHERLIGQIPSRLITRIFRLGADAAALLDDNEMLVARRSTIYRVSLETGAWAVDLAVPGGARALYLSAISDPATGERSICFGEYSTRFDGGAINIWRRGIAPDDAWQITGTFPAGEIDHVHNVCQVADGTIYILTGDFDRAAAIWKTDFALSSFAPVVRGSQDVRACWLWQSPAGALYFATDSQFETNHLRRIANGEIEDVAEIIGSSIHAYGDKERLIFSTAVEPGALSGKRWRDIFDRTPGPGIVSNDAALYLLAGGELSLIHREAKDRWPMRLAQFGTFKLPGGKMPADRLYAFGVGVKRNDGRCLYFRQ